MGFFKTCSEAFFRLLSFDPWMQHEATQHPLGLDTIDVQPSAAAPAFPLTCQYPAMKGYQSCNGPYSRSCWLKKPSSPQPLFSDFNIETPYEEKWPTGVHREFWINVSDHTISPDGYLKPEGKVINNTYPGPLIEACWGDDITIHVTNFVKTNGTTIHWHGVRQLHTVEADGVNGVTQCPIATGDTFTYNFKATQYGHSWYHSHYSLQYPDGVAGPLLIHGPTSANWDEQLEPILISDWSHNSAFQDFGQELAGLRPPMQTVLLGGIGNFTCSPTDPRCVPAAKRKPIFSRVFQKGKRYLLYLINSSTESSFVFTIDNHLLQIVTNDFVPIYPYKNESIHIGIGQRYAVIVEANPSAPVQADGNYWIRTLVSDNCGNITDNKPLSGVIRYDPKSTAFPTSTNHTSLSLLCADEPPENLVPVVPWFVSTQADNDVVKDTFEADIDKTPTHGAKRWDLTDTPLWLNFSSPTILNLANKTFNPEYAIVEEDYSRGFVYLVITTQLIFQKNKFLATAAHPIHLHGHDFAILAQSTANYSVTESAKTFNFNNPPRRDVALLPAGGYLAIAFKPDNPGIWLIHCHIAWHASSGLALQILERHGQIESTIGSLEPTKKTCQGWDKWLAGHTIDQDDSGI